MERISCGIDFGTSNSSVAVAIDRNITLVPLEESNVTIPSALFFSPQQAPVFGRKATQFFFERREGRFMRSLKRVLGNPVMKQGTMVNNKHVKFEKIIAAFLKHLHTTTNEFTKHEVMNVVMGRPVHFVDNDAAADTIAQEELRSIAHAVGFKNVEFQLEPIAAAFAHERKITKEQLAIVVDLGGGTSDFTIIKVSQDYMDKPDRTSDILASTGVRIGGNDFDKNLCLSIIMPELGYKSTYGKKHLEVPLTYYHDMAEWSKVNFLYTPKVRSRVQQYYNESHDQRRYGRLLKILDQEKGHSVLAATEESKIALTTTSTTETDMSFVEPDFFITAERDVFESAIAGDMQKILAAANECLTQASIHAADIQLVILTGGSTEIPRVKQAFQKLFPLARIADENKLSSVGIGLAYDSERRFR
ncbi:MAG: Hsp70 family protein [Chryseolinea sp.]